MARRDCIIHRLYLVFLEKKEFEEPKMNDMSEQDEEKTEEKEEEFEKEYEVMIIYY